MTLTIDGRQVVAKPDQSLLDIIKDLGMEGKRVSERPLAAKIAGEVFNLNYVPVRVEDVCTERPSIRRAGVIPPSHLWRLCLR